MKSEAPAVHSGIPVDSIRGQIQRVLANRRFASSERHCRLLGYLLEHTLDGRSEQLRESAIGVSVFDRAASSFDPTTDPIVRTELSRLRAKLKDFYESDGRDDAVLIDLPKRSYSLTFQLRAADAVLPASKPAAFSLGRKRIVTAACAIIAATGIWALLRANDHMAPHERRGDRSTSIAVLPFENLSADRDLEYFSDGLTEELIHWLAEIEGLRVISRTSAFQYKGKNEGLRTIAAQLNVEVILEGTVRRSGNRLRVTTSLVNAADGTQLRSQVYERAVEDLLAFQEEIARHVANTLRVHQMWGRGGIAIKRFTDSVDAYKLYLKGRYHANKGSEVGLADAIGYYERAIAVDPNYAPAHASLADAYIVLALLNEMPPGQAMPRAKKSAQHAVQSADTLSHAHSALGSVLALYDWDWAGAEKEFRRALELDPNDAGIREAYAMRYLLPQGRLNSALFEMQLAQGLDPFSAGIALGLGRVHHFMRETDQAIKSYQHVMHLDPGFEPTSLALAAAYVQRARMDQALNTLREASWPTEDEARLAALGHSYALAHQPDRAREVLEQLGEVARQGYVSGCYFAPIHLALGEKATALEWLEKAAAERSPLIAYMKVNPFLDNLHNEPRFAALLKKTGLGE